MTKYVRKVTDEQIIESFRRTKRYAHTAKELGGISRQAVEQRVLRLRYKGVDLPKALLGRARNEPGSHDERSRTISE